MTWVMADLGLQPKLAETQMARLTEGGEGVDFLGFHHRLVHSGPCRDQPDHLRAPVGPSRKAMQHALDRIRFMMMRARLATPVEQVVRGVAEPCAG